MRVFLQKVVLCFAIIAIFMTGIANAQLEDLIERYSGENAEGFVEPLVTAFGANLNTGLFHNAKVAKDGLHINLRLTAMVSIFGDDQKTFKAKTGGSFYPAGEVETSTIVGDEMGAILEGTGGTQYQFPGGLNLKSMAIVAPTLTVGNIAGTEASIRYFKANISDDIGDLSLIGFGFRHSISQYVPLFPLNIAAGAFYQKFKVGDIIESKQFIAHAEASKSFLLFDVYGGLGIESNSADLKYTYDDFGETQDISLSVKGDNKFRATVGLGMNLLMLHLNVDYNFGSQQLISAGLSLGL